MQAIGFSPTRDALRNWIKAWLTEQGKKIAPSSDKKFYRLSRNELDAVYCLARFGQHPKWAIGELSDLRIEIQEA